MPTIVSTGQITIVDQNDAKPITAFITSSAVTQQVYSKDESTVAFNPNYQSTPLVLTAKVYAGSTSDIAASLTNKKWWSTELGSGTSLGNGAAYSLGVNLTEAAPSRVYTFEGDYTDAMTGLSVHIMSAITVSLVKTGTNAVFIQVRGQNVIENATGTLKNNVTLVADLIRAAGVDTTGVLYRWFQSPHNTGDQIDGNLASVTTKYGFLDTAAQAAGVVGAIGSVKTTSGGTVTALTTVNIPDGGWVDLKAITIDESAVVDIGVFRVEAKDTDGTIYQTYFTVYDISDPYDLRIASSAGDKLQNGIGSTNLTPTVFYSGEAVASLTGWTFNWTLYDRNGQRCAFIDTSRTAVAGGRNITANTAGTSAAFTFDGAAISLTAGDIIKVVKPGLAASFYEVVASSTNVATIRTATVNLWLAYTSPVLSDFVGGKLYVCKTSGSAGAVNVVATTASTALTVTGDEIDAKGTISCEAVRP